MSSANQFRKYDSDYKKVKKYKEWCLLLKILLQPRLKDKVVQVMIMRIRLGIILGFLIGPALEFVQGLN